MRPLWTVILIMALTAAAGADDLYRVEVNNSSDAQQLEATGAKAVFVLGNGYLVLADSRASSAIKKSSLRAGLIAEDIDINQLMVDRRSDRVYDKSYSVLLEENNLRILERLPRKD